MDTKPLTIPVPPWAQTELEQVHSYVRESLPETLKSFWDSNGFGLAGFDRQPLRPYLVLLVARHYGCTGDRPLRLAASIHMIHMASLLHDRLGYARKAAAVGEDADQAHHQREALDILLGDFFFSKASRFIFEDGETRIIEEHIQTSLESAEAQARLVSLEKELDKVEPARCFEVVADKVSLLLTLSLRLGAILGKGQKEEEESLAGCGFLLGRMVRILEDLSIWERISHESSAIPPDARFSHPLILLWEKEGKEAWEEAARRLHTSGEQELAGLRAMLDEQGYLAASRRTAFAFAEQALGRLAGLPETEELRLLEEAVRFRLGPEQQPGQEVSP
jgi:geranylgeranyl pyrophosphate synthase